MAVANGSLLNECPAFGNMASHCYTHHQHTHVMHVLQSCPAAGLKPCAFLALFCLCMHFCSLLPACSVPEVFHGLWCSMQKTGHLTLLTVMSSMSCCSSAQVIPCRSSCRKLCPSLALLCKIQIGEHRTCHWALTVHVCNQSYI